MADSKIVRQLRYHHAGAPQQSSGEEAPVRAFGSGHQAVRPVPNNSIVPGAPDGPARVMRRPQTRNNPSPNPPGLTRRPGQISVTPGIGDDCVKVGRALAPSQLAMATNPEGFRVDARPVVGHVTPANGEPRGGSRPIRAVVALQGLTSEQRDLLDMLIDDFCGTHAGDAAKGSLVELAQETKTAIARIPVAQAAPAAQPAQELESLETPAPSAPSARPTRVGGGSGAHGRGGTNPPGEVKIFAPHTQPFETLAGRNSNETTPQT